MCNWCQSKYFIMKSCFLGQQVCTGNWSKSAANAVSRSAYETVLICILMLKQALISLVAVMENELMRTWTYIQLFYITSLEKLHDMWNCEEVPASKFSISKTAIISTDLLFVPCHF